MIEELRKAKQGRLRQEEQNSKILSFNLRWDTFSHPLMSEKIRGARFMEVLKNYNPDLIGFQEATDSWMGYLRTALRKLGYGYVGVGRDTGTDEPDRTGGTNEFAPVFYKEDIYELIQSGTFWLSETPEHPSVPAWDAECTRICSFTVLKNKKNGKLYSHFNTHLDHIGNLARENGMKLILSRMHDLKKDLPEHLTILTGDFNAVCTNQTTGKTEETYRLAALSMTDARQAAEQVVTDGFTFNQYPNPDIWETEREHFTVNQYEEYGNLPIDYIFLSKDTHYTIPYYTVVNDMFSFEYKGKRYHDHPCSDHYGVYCEISEKIDT